MATHTKDEAQIEREAGAIVDGKVFDEDGNHVPARLRVWGPTMVDGELCVIGEPIEFEMTEPNENYDGDRRAVIAADDLQVAVPMRCIRGDDRTEEESGGPAIVGGYVRLPGGGQYSWLTPAQVARLLTRAKEVVDGWDDGCPSEAALQSLKDAVAAVV